jgi:hypothetical protein
MNLTAQIDLSSTDNAFEFSSELVTNATIPTPIVTSVDAVEETKPMTYPEEVVEASTGLAENEPVSSALVNKVANLRKAFGKDDAVDGRKPYVKKSKVITPKKVEPLAPVRRAAAALLSNINQNVRHRQEEAKAAMATRVEGVDFWNVSVYSDTHIGKVLDTYFTSPFVHNDGVTDLGKWNSVACLVAWFNAGQNPEDEDMRTMDSRTLRKTIRERRIHPKRGCKLLAADAMWIKLCQNQSLMAELAEVPTGALWVSQYTYKEPGSDGPGEVRQSTEAQWWLPAVRAMHLASKDWMAASPEDRANIYPSFSSVIMQG